MLYSKKKLFSLEISSNHNTKSIEFANMINRRQYKPIVVNVVEYKLLYKIYVH